jgi:hypothetical protein
MSDDPLKAMARVKFPDMTDSKLDEWLRQRGVRDHLQAQIDAYREAADAIEFGTANIFPPEDKS